jgi:hypothetical protein
MGLVDGVARELVVKVVAFVLLRAQPPQSYLEPLHGGPDGCGVRGARRVRADVASTPWGAGCTSHYWPGGGSRYRSPEPPVRV